MDNIFIKQNDIIIFDDKHKLFCGDSTKIESYDFMENEIATMCFTSPPYNVSANKYGSNLCSVQKYINDSQDIRIKTSKYYGDNDSMTDDDYLKLLLDSSNNSLQKSKYLFLNIAHTSDNLISLIDFQYKMKDKYVDTIIWDKIVSLPVIQKNVLNADFEYIYIIKKILKKVAK